jgi:hypothetical protein
MAKNKNKTAKNPQKSASAQQAPQGKSISRLGWKVIGAGIALLIVGYFILTKTDPAGQNWASNLSPFLILGGYATIAIGIIIPEKKSASDASSIKI